MRGQRTTTTKVGLAAMAALALVVSGAIGASAAGRVATQGQAPEPRSAGTASPTESVFVPMNPCRIVNTQNSAGDIAAGELRSYRTNGNTSAQGGAAWCGIPATATALELSVSSVGAKGTGYLRVHPAGGATPTATFLNYGPGQNLTNAGTVAVRPGAAQTNLSVRAFVSDTHVVIDVLGYYVSELFAVVAAGADSAVRGNGVVSVTGQGSGGYTVVFDRNVTGCAYIANPGTIGAGTPNGYHVTVAQANGNANGVFVQTFSVAGGGMDQPFHLVVDC